MENVHQNPPLGAQGTYLQHKWLQALLPHICQLGQVFVSPLPSGFQNKIKYESNQQPPMHRAQKSQPEAILLTLFPCPLTNSEAISCQLSDALTFPLLSLQGKSSKDKAYKFKTEFPSQSSQHINFKFKARRGNLKWGMRRTYDFLPLFWAQPLGFKESISFF